MDSREIAKFAALVAAGSITEDLLLDQLGDDSIVSEIMAASGALAITGAASGLIEDSVDIAADMVDSVFSIF